MRRKLRPGSLWIHRIRAAVHDVLMERVFHKRLTVWITVKARRIRFVFREQRRRFPFVSKLIFAKATVLRPDDSIALQR